MYGSATRRRSSLSTPPRSPASSASSTSSPHTFKTPSPTQAKSTPEKPSPTPSDDFEDDIAAHTDWLIQLPSDTETLARYCRQKFNRVQFPTMPPFVLTSHLCIGTHSRAEVEQEIKIMVKNDLIREIPFTSCGKHTLLVFIDDLDNQLDTAKSRIEESTACDKEIRMRHLECFQNVYIRRIRTITATSSGFQMALLQDEKYFEESAEDVVRTVVQEGFLLQNRQGEYHLSVPNIGCFTGPLRTARDSVVRLISKERFHAINEKVILSKKLRRNPHQMIDIVKDLIGSQIVERVNGPNGDMIRIIRDS